MDFSILVGSCDKYSHLWPKFSKLFNKYWDHRIDVKKYIITQDLDANIEDFETIKTHEKNFTKGLKIALNKIQSNNILWLQDDYFFIRKINIGVFSDYFNFFSNNSVNRLGIHEWSKNYTFMSFNSKYFILHQLSNYTVSLQASLWRVDFIDKIIDELKDASPWDFEIDGSIYVNSNFHNHRILFTKQDVPWYLEACRKGQFTDDYYSICEKEGISINDIYKPTH